jgi:hypothetical protein
MACALAWGLSGSGRAQGGQVQAARARWREPAVAPAPPIRIDAARPGKQVQINFPAAAHAGTQRLTYWLTGQEDVIVDVQLAVGGDAGPMPLALSLALLLDGRQVPVSADGAAAATRICRTLARAGEVTELRLRLGGRRIPRGAHSAALLVWRDDGGEFPGVSFTIVKEDPAFAARAESSAFRHAPQLRPSGYGAWTATSPGVLLRGRPGQAQPDRTGGLDLRLGFGRYEPQGSGQPLMVSTVALLDGEQIPLANGEPALHARVGPTERVEAPLELRRLPPAVGGQHVLVLFLLPGDGQPMQAATGSPTFSARNPRWLGAARW